MPTNDPHPDAPYCSNCGYALTGLTESSKCPECGRPLVEVLARPAQQFRGGKRYRSKSRVFGMPVLDVALGPHGTELRGHARGFIAVGDIATGVLAIAGLARGVVAFGGLALGAFSMGGLSMGLVAAMGGCSIGGIAIGGAAIGIVATGGVAIGAVASGGSAVGYFARGGAAVGTHVIRLGFPPDPLAVDTFSKLRWLVGGWPPPQLTMLQAVVVPLAATIVSTTLISLTALSATKREQ